MSAWVCSELHINMLATFLAAREIEVEWHGQPFKCINEPANVANILFAETVASVNYRYNESEPTVGHKYELVTPLPELVVIHKQLACYRYQACEHPRWEQTLAYALTKAGIEYIEHHMGRTSDQIEAMPEWNSAPWGID